MNKSFLTYTEWKETADTIRTLFQKLPVQAHARLYITLNGLSTGVLHSECEPFEISIDFREHCIIMHNAAGKSIRIRLQNGTSIAQYNSQINHALAYIGLPVTIEPDTDEKHHSYDATAATLFFENLLFAYHALESFFAPYTTKADFPLYDAECMELSGSLKLGDGGCYRFGFRSGNVQQPDPLFYVMHKDYEQVLTLKEVFDSDHPQEVVAQFLEKEIATQDR